MSTAAAADAGAAPKKKGLPKKLMIILLAVVLVIAAGGGAAVYFMKKKAADAAAAEEADGGDHAAAAAKHDDHKTAPVFVPLDPFTVNLADRDTERFAQIAVTMQVEDAHMGESLKTYMPAIRDSILMILSHKTSAELLERVGKEKLAREIGIQTARAMGYEVEDEEAADADAKPAKAHGDDDEEDPKPKKKKKKKPAGDANPIKHVLFANFIIQ